MNNKLKPVLLGAVFLVVITNLLTYNWAQQEAADDQHAENFNFFREDEADERDEYSLLYEVMETLDQEYIDDIDREKLLEGAIDGLLGTLDDPQTTFLDAEDMDEFTEFVVGSFGGVGIRVIDSDEGLTVVDVLPGTPAENAEMQPGDRVQYVEDEDIREMEMERSVELIRGEIGSEVNLQVQRPGAEDLMDFSLVRQEVSAPTVESDWLDADAGLGYLEINQFGGNTGEQFRNELLDLEGEGLEGLVLDLRGNPGGILGEALEVARMLVPEGEIVRIVDRHDEVKDVYHSQAEEKPYPIVVMIDSHSASGSEIVAGALHERAGSYLVGEPTFGKATVQEIKRFDGGRGMRFTASRYETPGGVDLHGEGLTPDYEVEMPPYLQFYYHLIPGELSQGDYGKTVEVLQDMLNALGYDIESQGYFGEETEEALRQFQEDQGVVVDGKFNDITWLTLQEEMDKVIKDVDTQLQKALELLEGNK